MPQIHCKRSNGEQHDFNLTANSSVTDGWFVSVIVNGQTLYARVGTDWTPLVVNTSRGQGYVQYNSVNFKNFYWEKKGNTFNETMSLYMPRGRYRIYIEGKNSRTEERYIENSITVSIRLWTSGVNTFRYDISSLAAGKLIVGQNTNKCYITRIDD